MGIKQKLSDLVLKMLGGGEPSGIEERIMGTGAAMLDVQTRRDIQAIEAGHRDFDFYINTFRQSASEMRRRQEVYTQDLADVLLKCLPGMVGAAGVDYALPTDVPTTTVGVGVYSGIRALGLLHKYSRFRRSKAYCVKCAEELKEHISEHRDELLDIGDAAINTIIDEAEGLVVSGNTSQQYHQLQHLDSVIKTVQYNRSLIRNNSDRIDENAGDIEEASQRLKAIEAGMLKHRYKLEEADDRLARVEKYTYCECDSAVQDDRAESYDDIIPFEEGMINALQKAYVKMNNGVLIL